MAENILLAAFDMDGTLTKSHFSSWQYVLEKIDKWDPQGTQNLNDFLKGNLKGNSLEENYAEFCKRDAALLKGLKYEDFINILDTIEFHDHIGKLIEYLHSEYNAICGIISAGFYQLANKAKKKFGFDFVYANRLLTTDGRLDGKIDIQVSWHGKRKILCDVQKQFGFTKNETISFGEPFE